MKKFVGSIRIGFKYHRHLGPRCDTAGVTLYLSTHDSYIFVSTAQWPEDDYSRAVERGVRDVLREAGYDPDMGGRVHLKAVEYDHVDSCEGSFYAAAKSAAKAQNVIYR